MKTSICNLACAAAIAGAQVGAQGLAADDGLPAVQAYFTQFGSVAGNAGPCLYGALEHQGKVWIWGDLLATGRPTGTFAVADFSGAPLNTRPMIVNNGASVAAVSDGAGGWFLAGWFGPASGVPRSGVVRVKNDGAIDLTFDADLGPAPGGTLNVGALAVHDGVLYLGGSLGSAGGQPRAGLAAVSVASGAVLPWNATLSRIDGAPPFVSAIAAGTEGVFVAGSFDFAGGAARDHSALLDHATGAALPWAAPRANVDPLSAALDAGAVYFGGSFSSVGVAPRDGVCALDRATGALLPWSPALGTSVPGAGVVAGIAAHGGRVVVYGTFVSAYGLAVFDAPVPGVPSATPYLTGAGSYSVNPGNAPSIRGVALNGDEAFLIGYFDVLKGEPRRGVGAINLATGVTTGWNPRASISVPKGIATSATAVAMWDVAALDFVAETTRLYATDASTMRPTGPSISVRDSFAPGVAGGVYGAAASDGVLFVSGYFGSVNGAARSGLAAVDAASGVVLPWSPAPNSIVDRMLVHDGALYVAGAFSQVAGQARPGLAAFDLATLTLLPWAPVRANTAGSVASRFAAGAAGEVWLYGQFTSVNGVPRRNLALVDAATGATLPFDASIDGGPIVHSIAPTDSSVFVRGAFTGVGGLPRAGLAELPKAGGPPTSWNPGLQPLNPFGSFFVGQQNEVLTVGSNVVVGGGFSSAGGLLRHGFAEIDRTTGAVGGIDPYSAPYSIGGGAPFFVYDGKAWCGRDTLRAFPITGPIASVNSIGAGLGGAVSSKESPRLGDLVTWSLAGAPANAPGVMIFGAPSPSPLGLPDGNVVLLDLNAPLVFGPAFQTDVFGAATDAVFVPAHAAYWGLSFREQLAVFGGASGLTLTNALDVVLGY